VDDGDPTFPAIPSAVDQLLYTGPCYEVTGSTSVPVGSAVVWLEPLRTGAGYGFRYGAAGSSLSTGTSTFGSGYTMVADDTYEDIGLTLSLPSAGSYLFTGFISVLAEASVVGTNQYVLATLFDQTLPGFVVPSITWVVASIQAAGGRDWRTTGIVTTVPYVVNSPRTIGIKGFKSSGGTWTRAEFQNLPSNGGGSTSLGYLKIG